MSSDVLKNIQQSLNTIRKATADEDAKTKLSVLALILNTSERIVANTRQMNQSTTQKKQRQKKQTPPIAPLVKPNTAKQNDAKNTDKRRDSREKRSTAAVKPEPPLTIQQQQNQYSSR